MDTRIKKPRILIVFAKRGTATSTRFGGFVTRIKNAGGFEYADVVDCVALEDLVFRIYSTKKARVLDINSTIDVSTYDFVYFKSWQSLPAEAASLAFYLEGMGIPYTDTQVRHEFTLKTTNNMALWAHGIAVPPSIWGSRTALSSYIKTKKLTYPLIAKAVDGEKGRDNYLARTKLELVGILYTADKPMIIQDFIPNDGDYRIGVYGSRARWSIYRKSGGKSHLNNTSAGGTAVHMAVSELPDGVASIAERAAAACDLEISGVDVVVDNRDGSLYVFEANQGSQIVTGAFIESNMKAFDRGMKSLVSNRNKAHRKTRKQVVGRHVNVEIKHDEQTIPIHAKIDTGAYQSAVDAENIEITATGELKYAIRDPSSGLLSVFTTSDFGYVTIKTSVGHFEKRYVVPMELMVNGRAYKTRVTLAKRKQQKFQMLLGRTLISGNFLVDVEYSSRLGE